MVRQNPAPVEVDSFEIPLFTYLKGFSTIKTMVVWDFFGDYHRNPKNGGVVPMIPFPLGICLD